MNSLEISKGINAAKLLSVNNNIIFQVVPKELRGCDLMLFLSDSFGKEINKQVFAKPTGVVYEIPQLPHGIYFFNVFCRKGNGNLFWGYFYNNDILLEISSKGVSFMYSPYGLANSIKYTDLTRKAHERDGYTFRFQMINRELKTLSEEIVKGIHFNYAKILAIHDWIANNIFYDVDALNSGSYKYSDSSAITTLRSRKGVCQGYTNLSIALFRTIGIPAFEIPCYALGISTSGGWSNENNQTTVANHVISAAYDMNRWILMDITWDSDNILERGVRKQKTGRGLSRKYFDPSIQYLSNTHRFL